MSINEYIDQYISKHEGSAYMTGAPAALQHGLGMAIEFATWCADENYYSKTKGLWIRSGKYYTTSELFTKYLETI